MPSQIIKQPDGKYAIFSTVVDDFEVTDCTPKELIGYMAKRAARRAREETKETINQIERGEKPYYEYTISWKQAFKESQSTQKANAKAEERRRKEKSKNGAGRRQVKRR